ncbi:hypothetical protein [Sneathia sanguinegens]|uniref:hypothetical protein n=1 Tax=Sneathia sanguinegens TaxID=40543 RepID=UPI00258479E7|nr:hypothetical protein [Sneathia sanguinegens]MDU4652706.1 hypothetical protein [Sneathia sanguinegens]
MENPLNFKTYKEFEKEMIDDLDNDEKLDLYNQYCENNNDYDSMLYKNNDKFLKYIFDNNLKIIISGLAKAIAYGDYKYSDEYVKVNGYGDLQSYYNLNEALKDNFVDSELIDFITENKNIDFEDLYIEYIDNTLKEAKKSMSKDEFSEALKEYTSEEMIKKYLDVYDTINYSYSDFILDEKDIQKSKEIDDDLER